MDQATALLAAPHLSRAISVVIMIETIFLLTVFAEIFVTTSGGPSNATTNLAFLIYARALLQYDVGGASAGGVVAIILATSWPSSWCAASPGGWRSDQCAKP